jgi:uncharacterized protein YggE
VLNKGGIVKRFIPLLFLAVALYGAQISFEANTVSVMGVSSVLVLADAANVEFRVEIRETDMSRFTGKANELSAEITKELRKIGIDHPLIQNGPADIYTELNWESQRLEYLYGIRLGFPIEDISKVDQVLAILASASSKSQGSKLSSYVVNYFLKDPGIYLPKLQEMALADAEAKAAQAASAHGLNVGELTDCGESAPYANYLPVWDPYSSWDFATQDLGGKSTLPRVALGYNISATFKLIE